MSERTMIDIKDVLRVIDDAPEFGGYMPDEMWKEVNGNRLATHAAIVAAVKLTKERITKRIILDALRQSDE